MATPKYRPYLTLEELQVTLNALTQYEPEEGESIHLKSATTALRMLMLKIDGGIVSSAYVPTGNKPGPASARDILLSPDKSPEVSKEEALTQISIYKNLGQEIPAHLTKYLEDSNNENI